MTEFELFQEQVSYNSTHILFTMTDDATLGNRLPGYYVRIIEDEGHQCQEFVFDNGEHFIHDIEEAKLFIAEPIPDEFFLHKHLEKEVSDFMDKYRVCDADGNILPIYCDFATVQVSTFIQLHPYRNQKIVYLPQIMLPSHLRKQGLGLQLIKQIYDICCKFGYSLRICQMVETFYNRMVARGATVITPFDEVEINGSTIFGRL